MLKRAIAFLTIPAAAFALSACDVEQTEEGEAPEIEVQEGQLPEYDVESDIEVTEDTVTVPSLDIDDDRDTIPDTTTIR